MGDTPGSQTISTKLRRLAKQAGNYPNTVFNNLHHLINKDLLREAYRQTRKDGATGIDKVTAKEYAANLEENLENVRERLKRGQYKAPCIKRCWIQEDGGKERPIGITTFEDKIVQRAVVMVMSSIYDHDFYDFSHGFIKGHSPHQALDELRRKSMGMNIGWIIDADISGFFDNLDHGQLRSFIKQRINDGGIIRLIGKWLKAGVLEDETVIYPDKGTPQGGVISPLLANIYLHHVLDEWFVKEVQSRMKGKSFLIRFADDFIIACELEGDAHRIMDVLPKRFGRYGLTLHPKKTVKVKFRKPQKNTAKHGNSTFNFLGFTHYWAQTLRGNWVIKRKTASKRLHRFMKKIWLWCKKNRHDLLKEQYKELSSKLRGYYQYYGIRCNYKALEVVFEYTERAWRYWLSRRSHKSEINWEKYLNSIRNKMPLPKPRIIHNI